MTPADKFYAERRSTPRPATEPLEPSTTFLWITGSTVVAAILSLFVWVASLS